MQEFEDDEIGELDGEDPAVQGRLDLDQLKEYMEEFLESQKGKAYQPEDGRDSLALENGERDHVTQRVLAEYGYTAKKKTEEGDAEKKGNDGEEEGGEDDDGSSEDEEDGEENEDLPPGMPEECEYVEEDVRDKWDCESITCTSIRLSLDTQ
jgi:hypothetical protein